MTTDHLSSELLLEAGAIEAGLPAPAPRASYTLDFKLRVVDWVQRSGASYRAASRTFGVDRKLLRSWVERRATLSSALAALGPQRRKLHSGRPPACRELETDVVAWLVAERASGRPVSNAQLQRRALEVAGRLQLPGFKATPSWLSRWKHRNNVASRNGTNDIVGSSEEEGGGGCEGLELCGSALLSHVSPSDTVSLSRQRLVREEGAGQGAGPVHLDYSTPEHCYCLPAEPGLSLPSNNSLLLGPSHPLLSLSGADDIIAGAVTGLDLPLGHEETVGLPAPAPARRLAASRKRGASKSGGRGGRGRGRGHSPNHCVAVPLGLEELYLGGLLASRLSQPFLPSSAPEVVYIDMPSSS